MLQYLAEVLVKRHAAIAGSLFAASAIGSFMYTVNYGSSAFVDAHTLIAGEKIHCEFSNGFELRFYDQKLDIFTI
eukprot:jgi/Picsp_1/3631/NSC_06468-R1_---NA---